MMQGILIDPFARAVTAIETDGDLAAIYAALRCETVTALELPNEDTVYLDDEGLFVKGQAFFSLQGHPHALAGRALVLGTTEDGDSASPRSSVRDVLLSVRWVAREEAARQSANGDFDGFLVDGRSVTRLPCRPTVLDEDD